MSALDDSRQAALAAEHRAVFGYSLLGPRLSGNERQLAVTDAAAHEKIRDATEAALAAGGVTPVGPDADYPSLFPVTDEAAARKLAVRLEEDAAVAWRFVYATAATSSASASDSARTQAQRYLTASAVRAVRWRNLVDPQRASTPFPGI